MSVHTILQRWSARPIALVEAPSFGASIELAVTHEVSLLYADLQGAYLAGRRLVAADLRGVDCTHADASGSDLSGADLRSARLVAIVLRDALLRGADFRHADLHQADLRRTDLRQARLTGADLRGAVFQGAKLDGACLDWRWSSLPLELLRRHPAAAGDGARAVARLAFSGDERPFAWLKILLQEGQATEWALGVFADHILPGDNAPSLLRRLAANAAPSRPELPPLWTRPDPSIPPQVVLRRA